MILTGNKISEEISNERICIEPFQMDQITTNSYDLRLGNKYLVYTQDVIDTKQPPTYEEKEIPDDGLVMKAGDFILGHSEEIIGSNHYVPLIHAKSGTARMGLFVHVTADLIDIGSIGNSTFQLYATLPVKIFKGMLIAQVTFWVPEGKIDLYQGKYQHSRGPQPSRTYLDHVT
ncbi:dCTP deaminase [Pantoea agglomerans]|uniref:dCTP deaminase n=1 Tax=Enterobacter agglomerans TaxID=549 RepID=UPI00165465B1|nr:dCTP deaminase [Pantoea agglomerans]